MDPASFEFATGVRLTLQNLPNCQQSLDSLNIPLSIHVTPAKKLESVFLSFEAPNKCVCGGFLSPSTVVNFATKTWFCNFCLRSNKLSAGSAQSLQPNSLLPEQEPTNCVFEYKLPDSKANPSFTKNNFMMLVDTCLSPENLEALKKGLVDSIAQIDFERTQIVLFSFSRNVHLYKNNATDTFCHSALLPGYLTIDQAIETLGLKRDLQKDAVYNTGVLVHYVFTSHESLVNAINSIEEDQFEISADERASRCSGKALEFALEFVRFSHFDAPRILLFLGGPCTYSSGRIADNKISSFIRKHLDLEQNAEVKTQIEGVKKFYQELANKAVQLKTVIDIWAFSLTEFGLFEMEDLSSKTNGLVVMNEEFKQEHFHQSILKYFRINETGSIAFGSNATIEILFSKEIKISGCVGNCQSQNTKPASQSENPIGQANTTKWSVGGMDHESTYLFVLELAEKSKSKGASKYSKAYFQFVVTYKHPINGLIARVISFDRPFVPFDNPLEMLAHVDQFSVISTFAKLAAFKVFEYDNVTLIRYLDKTLISILKTFKAKNDSIAEEIGLIAQYFYYLRKSNFVKKFASSLDEMTFYKHTVLRENIDNTLIIIQPQLIEYSLANEEPRAVMPDLSCLKKDVILLADTFFNIIIWNGPVIKGWVDDGYHLQAEYSHVADLLKMPEDDFAVIVEERVIPPNKIFAFHGSPTERFLKSRLNPETGNIQQGDLPNGDEGNFVTEDASLSVFMTRLLEFLVDPKS